MELTTLTTIASTEGFKKLAEAVLKHLGVGLEKILSDRSDSQKKASDRKKGALAAVEEINIVGDKLLEAREKGLIVSYEAGQVKISVDPNAKTSSELELLANRAQRITTVELKQQENVEDILAVSAKILSEHDEVSGRPIDEDWLGYFFSNAKDISSEEMKLIWGRILAGEIKEPGSFSMRTIQTVRHMTRSQAEMFQRLASLTIEAEKGVHFVSYYYDMSMFGLPFEEIIELTDLGFLSSFNQVDWGFNSTDKDPVWYLKYGGESWKATFSNPMTEVHTPILPLTKLGVELLKLTDRPPTQGYFDYFIRMVESFNLVVFERQS